MRKKESKEQNEISEEEERGGAECVSRSCEKKLIDQGGCRRKCNCVISVALVATLVGTAFWAVKHQVNSAIGMERADFLAEIQKLNTQLIDLQSKIEENRGESNSQSLVEARRRGWQAWCELRFKLEKDENFDQELENFKQIFANDNVLLFKVSDLLKDFLTEGSSENAHKSGINKFYDKVKSVVSFRKIDKKKIEEISGYVLTSNCR